MNSIEEAYTSWSMQYDTNKNRTRDMEATALRKMLTDLKTESVLEIGCGTGKNTVYLSDRSANVMAVDLTEAMLVKAREKVTAPAVRFVKADITKDWSFTDEQFNLVTFSLVLEHVENLDFVFAQVSRKLSFGGYLYVGELHPFKQYSSTKARFETESGFQEVDCYTHHLSDFIQAAKRNGFQLVNAEEFFDEVDRTGIPRILSLLFIKA